jgi:hypothetical protein
LVNGGGSVYNVNATTGAATYLNYSLGTEAHHGDFDPENGYYYGINSNDEIVVASLTPTSGSVLNTLPGTSGLHTLTFTAPHPVTVPLSVSGKILLGLLFGIAGFMLLRRREQFI